LDLYIATKIVDRTVMKPNTMQTIAAFDKRTAKRKCD